MGRKQKFIEKLSVEEHKTLEQAIKNSTRSDFRLRCQVILLSYKRFTTAQIMEASELSKLTVYKCLSKWRSSGISGLLRQKGQGRKPRLDVNNSEHVSLVEKKVASNAQQIEQLIPEIIEALGVEPFSKWTLKRFLKKLTTLGNGSAEN